MCSNVAMQFFLHFCSLYIFLLYICDMKEQIDILILKYGKVKVSEMLGITRPTLDKRLKLDNWKKSEIHLLVAILEQEK